MTLGTILAGLLVLSLPWGTSSLEATAQPGWVACQDAPPEKILGETYCVLDTRLGTVPVTARYWYRGDGLHMVTVNFETRAYVTVRRWLAATYGYPGEVQVETLGPDEVRSERVLWVGSSSYAILSLKPAFSPSPLERAAGAPLLTILPTGWTPPRKDAR